MTGGRADYVFKFLSGRVSCAFAVSLILFGRRLLVEMTSSGLEAHVRARRLVASALMI